MRRRSVAIVGLVLGASALAPASATGDGLSIGSVDAGWSGVTRPESPARYVTVPARSSTVLARVRRDGGQVLQSRVLRGTFTIPAVALDGSASGLSADGRTLVLIRPRPAFPRARTVFAVLDARLLRVRRILRLAGDFSFDALSPDGRTMYLVEYTSRRDPSRYAVRAFDLRAGRLLPGAIVDRREPDERMRGYPITRTSSPDGRWEYTLYDGAGSHPFVHALDTVDREAFCIDLDALARQEDLYRLGLALGGGGRELIVRDRTRPLAVVDRTTFEVREPAPEPRHAAPAPDAADGPPWTIGATAAGAVLLAAAAALVARRRRSAGPAQVDEEIREGQLLH
jgi:hypothetical protein